MSKHTPGPWTLETVKTQVGICHKIGEFPGSCGRDVGHACIYVDGYAAPSPRTGKEAELLANARLIVAAPDLLESLDVFSRVARIIDKLPSRVDDETPLRDVCPGAWPTVGDCRKALAAISKATGDNS